MYLRPIVILFMFVFSLQAGNIRSEYYSKLNYISEKGFLNYPSSQKYIQFLINGGDSNVGDIAMLLKINEQENALYRSITRCSTNLWQNLKHLKQTNSELENNFAITVQEDTIRSIANKSTRLFKLFAGMQPNNGNGLYDGISCEVMCVENGRVISKNNLVSRDSLFNLILLLYSLKNSTAYNSGQKWVKANLASFLNQENITILILKPESIVYLR